MESNEKTSVIPARKAMIEKTFQKRSADGLWKLLPPDHHHYPVCQHYVPTFRASLWVLIYLADLQCEPEDERVKKPLEIVKSHFFDAGWGIYTLGKDHFPIPCLNGNLLYLDAYFNGFGDERSSKVLEFFANYQRFDDGSYTEPKHQFCSNKSCYGKHSCIWGIVKLLKGLSFIAAADRTAEAKLLLERCIGFVLQHRVCFSSRKTGRLLVPKIDLLSFPNMYHSDFLEILWLLKREEVQSPEMSEALALLAAKRDEHGNFMLERPVNNLIVSAGPTGKDNAFVSARANEVLAFYS